MFKKSRKSLDIAIRIDNALSVFHKALNSFKEIEKEIKTEDDILIAKMAEISAEREILAAQQEIINIKINKLNEFLG